MQKNWYYWVLFSLVFVGLFLWRVAILPAFGRGVEVFDPLWLGLLCLCIWRQWPQAFLWAVLAGIFVMPYEKLSDGVFLIAYGLCVWVGRYLLTFVFTHESWYAILIISGLLSALFFWLVWVLGWVLVFILGTSGLGDFRWLEWCRFIFVHSMVFFVLWVGMRTYRWMKLK